MGRPPIELTLEAVEALARIGVTHRTMALALRVSERTIERRFAEDPEFQAAVERGRADREVVLRKRLYEFAVDKNRTVRSSAVRALGMLLAEFGVGERSTVEHTGTQAVMFVLPANDRIPCVVDTTGRDLLDEDGAPVPALPEPEPALETTPAVEVAAEVAPDPDP